MTLLNLRSGYTTGACAAAAAKGAALMLVNQISISEVSIELPGGDSATFALSGQIVSTDQASCFVIKDAGDDPDVTNGAEVHANVRSTPDCRDRITIEGGKGIGRVTKPGLAVSPGQWAINPVPRLMIETAVHKVIPPTERVNVTISIPDGEERAKKTLNARLGILGGLSILGTTGIVRPISAKAWTDTLDAALDVAKACGSETVVLSTGRTSEMAAQKWFSNPPLSEEAYIMMGDHIAYALLACQERGFLKPVIACQFAKLLKIACGHENTHAAASDLDLTQLLTWGQDSGLSDMTLTTISNANTAREIAISCSFEPHLLQLVFRHASSAARKHAAEIYPHFLVADYGGNCVSDSR
jgi:cobalt-precorrin-5B (C1)-methyltransferase